MKIWTLTTESENRIVVTAVDTTKEGLLDHALAALSGWDDERNMVLHDTTEKAVEALENHGFRVHVDEHELTLDTEVLMMDVQLAQDAAYGDSNDTEIELLRGALDQALRLLGLDLPEGRDPDDED